MGQKVDYKIVTKKRRRRKMFFDVQMALLGRFFGYSFLTIHQFEAGGVFTNVLRIFVGIFRDCLLLFIMTFIFLLNFF